MTTPPGEARLVLPRDMATELTRFLAARTEGGREALALVLCGPHRGELGVRLLGRHLILPEDDCFRVRAAGRVELGAGVDHLALEMAEAEGLALVQVHTHVSGAPPTFSPVDDHHERERSRALGRLGVELGSVVFDRTARRWAARLWTAAAGGDVTPEPMGLATTLADELGPLPAVDDERYVRQVPAFGAALQARLDRLRVGVVGVGGLGAPVVEALARLGVRQFTLVDPDGVERSNLNRLTGASERDARRRRPKVEVARETVGRVHGRRARVRAFASRFPGEGAARALADCHLLVAATDNHASRLALQELAAAYLRPLVHVGLGFAAGSGTVERIEGRVTAPPVGGPWCLACAGAIDPLQAVREAADPEHAAVLAERGYLPGTPAPAVYWANLRLAAEAVQVIHGLVLPFGPTEPDNAVDRYVDLLAHEVLNIVRPGTGGCLVCGPHGLRGLGDARGRRQAAEVPELALGAEARQSTAGEPGPVGQEVPATPEAA